MSHEVDSNYKTDLDHMDRLTLNIGISRLEDDEKKQRTNRFYMRLESTSVIYCLLIYKDP